MGVLEGCDRFLKYIFFLFTFVLFLLGCCAIGIGAWASVDKGFEDRIDAKVPGVDAHALKSAALLLIIVGVGIMLVGFLGCCGAMKENQCFLALFSLCLFLIFALMIAGAVMAANYQGALQDLLKKGIGQLKGEYGEVNASTAAIDTIQKKYKCCVFHAPEDIPDSCYNGTAPTEAAVTTPEAAVTTPKAVVTTPKALVTTPKALVTTPAATPAATTPPAVATTVVEESTTGNNTAGRRRREAGARFRREADDAGAGPYTKDCAAAIMNELVGALDQYKYRIGGIGVASAIIVVLGMVVSMALCCKIRRGYQGV